MADFSPMNQKWSHDFRAPREKAAVFTMTSLVGSRIIQVSHSTMKFKLFQVSTFFVLAVTVADEHIKLRGADLVSELVSELASNVSPFAFI